VSEVTDEPCCCQGQGLYQKLGLPLPNAPAAVPFPILIHGGSTTMGQWGIQFARASGLSVVATASPHNFELLRSLGAAAVFDYHDPGCGAAIRAYTENKLRHAWDCAGGGEVLCAGALSSSEPSMYGAINTTDDQLLLDTNPLVDGPHYSIAYDCLGEPWHWKGSLLTPGADEVDFTTMFFELTRGLLEKGVVKPVTPTVNRTGSGLAGALLGIDELRTGKVSGTKLVYTL
jgi:hypothetical protein